MTFAESVRYCLSNYAAFRGRGSRSEFWWFMLASFIVNAICGIFDIVTRTSIVGPLVGLVLIVPTFAAGARRLHDRDRTGWWQLLFMIPVIGEIVLIVWFATSGTLGANRYGEAPAVT